MKPKMATIIGNVGAGKSSALKMVAECLQAKPVDADNLFQTSDPFAKDFLNDNQRWALANELWLTKERADLLRKELTLEDSEWLVVDSGLLMSWVYTYSHLLVGKMTQDEWDLYEDLFDALTQGIESEIVIWLDYKMSTLLQRIEKRGRDYELEYYSETYLRQLNQGIDALVEKLAKTNTRLIRITEAEVADFVTDKQGVKDFRNCVLTKFKE